MTSSGYQVVSRKCCGRNPAAGPEAGGESNSREPFVQALAVSRAGIGSSCPFVKTCLHCCSLREGSMARQGHGLATLRNARKFVRAQVQPCCELE